MNETTKSAESHQQQHRHTNNPAQPWSAASTDRGDNAVDQEPDWRESEKNINDRARRGNNSKNCFSMTKSVGTANALPAICQSQ